MTEEHPPSEGMLSSLKTPEPFPPLHKLHPPHHLDKVSRFSRPCLAFRLMNVIIHHENRTFASSDAARSTPRGLNALPRSRLPSAGSPGVHELSRCMFVEIFSWDEKQQPKRLVIEAVERTFVTDLPVSARSLTRIAPLSPNSYNESNVFEVFSSFQYCWRPVERSMWLIREDFASSCHSDRGTCANS